MARKSACITIEPATAASVEQVAAPFCWSNHHHHVTLCANDCTDTVQLSTRAWNAVGSSEDELSWQFGTRHLQLYDDPPSWRHNGIIAHLEMRSRTRQQVTTLHAGQFDVRKHRCALHTSQHATNAPPLRNPSMLRSNQKE